MSSIQDKLIFVENQPGSLKCTAIGGYPPPVLDIYIGNGSGEGTLVTDFELSRKVSLTGRKGLRRMLYITEKVMRKYVVGLGDDGREVRCVASVSGLTAKLSKTNIITHHGAQIQCDPAEARLGEMNFNLRCTFQVRPKYIDLFWLIDENGTSVREAEVVMEYWTIIMDLADDCYETQLFMRLITVQSFRKYRLFVGNKINKRHYDVILRPKQPAVIKQEIKRKAGGSSKQESANRHFISDSRFLVSKGSVSVHFDPWESKLRALLLTILTMSFCM